MLEFKPQLSPKEMLEMGIFGGWYFKTQDNIKEFPAESKLISKAEIKYKLNTF